VCALSRAVVFSYLFPLLFIFLRVLFVCLIRFYFSAYVLFFSSPAISTQSFCFLYSIFLFLFLIFLFLFPNFSPRALSKPQRTRVNRRVAQLAGQGYRVLAVAQRYDHHPRQLEDNDVCGLTLLGFVVLADPVRPAAAASIAGLRDAGVNIVMITGDHPATAEAVAGRLNVLGSGLVITGPELDDLDDAALDRVLPQVTVVARGTPAHKVRVVQAFQRLRRTVAMTGDGANDAPAIRLADVGIALGHRATPAARATADLVVTDDRLETIIAALVEGRAMWGSVRQALGILVGGNLGEIAFTVLGAALTGRSPLSARQLLLVNLLTDLAPAMAIALRAPHPGNTAALLAEGPEASLGSALTRDITSRAVTTALATSAAWAAARFTGRAALLPPVLSWVALPGMPAPSTDVHPDAAEPSAESLLVATTGP